MSSNSPGRRATRLAKILVDITWWAGIAGAVFLTALVVLWPLATPEGLDPSARVDVSISDATVRERLDVAAAGPTAVRAELEDVRGSLELHPTRWWLVLLGAIVAGLGLGATLLAVHLLRSFLKDVLNATVLTATNATRLNRLGWVLVAAGVAWPLLDFAYATVLLRSAQLSGVSLGLSVQSIGTVIPGLLVLVVAATWQYGVELQTDRDLTV